MIKLVLISHTFRMEKFIKRWRDLANKYLDLDITLLAPYEWTVNADKRYAFGKPQIEYGKTEESERFHIVLIDMNTHRFSGWTSKELKGRLKEIKPDLIYHIGLHNQESLVQTILIRNKCLPHTKVMAFSMRGPQHNIKLKKQKDPVRQLFSVGAYLKEKHKLSFVNKYCDAMLCHYPIARGCFIKEGFKNPVYIQTQIGVNTDLFYKDENKRKRIRDEYKISDDVLVFGSATRLTREKGIFDILEALPHEGNYKYMMLGGGSDAEIEKIKQEINKRGLEDKVIMTGHQTDMPAYWNAIDCALHLPRELNTSYSGETFSLSLAQAMATGLPVIGNTCGSVPYQIGSEGIICKEGDVKELRAWLEKLLNDRELGENIGKTMAKRAGSCFSTHHLNDCFYYIVLDVIAGRYDRAKTDMAEYFPERTKKNESAD